MIYSKQNIRYICVYCGKTVYSVYKGNPITGQDVSLQESYFFEKTRKNIFEKIQRHMAICSKFKKTIKESTEYYLPCRKQRF